jgi:hypothetical protein
MNHFLGRLFFLVFFNRVVCVSKEFNRRMWSVIESTADLGDGNMSFLAACCLAGKLSGLETLDCDPEPRRRRDAAAVLQAWQAATANITLLGGSVFPRLRSIKINFGSNKCVNVNAAYQCFDLVLKVKKDSLVDIDLPTSRLAQKGFQLTFPRLGALAVQVDRRPGRGRPNSVSLERLPTIAPNIRILGLSKYSFGLNDQFQFKNKPFIGAFPKLEDVLLSLVRTTNPSSTVPKLELHQDTALQYLQQVSDAANQCHNLNSVTFSTNFAGFPSSLRQFVTRQLKDSSARDIGRLRRLLLRNSKLRERERTSLILNLVLRREYHGNDADDATWWLEQPEMDAPFVVSQVFGSLQELYPDNFDEAHTGEIATMFRKLNPEMIREAFEEKVTIDMQSVRMDVQQKRSSLSSNVRIQNF